VEYGDYIGNVTWVAVELANQGGVAEPSALMRQMFDEHAVGEDAPDLGRLPGLVRVALGELVEAVEAVGQAGPGGLDAVSTLLSAYPPDLHLSDHDGQWHIHFARDGATAERWLGQTVAAALAHVAAGDPGVTLGLCAAEGCGNYFVDQSRNRTRRFCGNACASRTTVAAYRARARN
jgi:predicted RNA-binding Zn ribbon-like protein